MDPHEIEYRPDTWTGGVTVDLAPQILNVWEAFGRFQKRWYQIIHFNVFFFFNQPFWGTPILGSPHFCLVDVGGFTYRFPAIF